MIGVSYQRCGMLDDAERAYRQCAPDQAQPRRVAVQPRRGSTSGPDGFSEARQYWDSAIKANGRLVGARSGIATLELEQIRKIRQPQGRDLEEARGGRPGQPVPTRSGADSDNVAAYTVLRPGLHWRLAEQQEPVSTIARAAARRGLPRRNEKYAAAAERLRPALHAAGRSNQPGAGVVQRRGRARPEVRRGADERRPVTLGFRKYDTGARDVQQGDRACRPRTTTRTSAWASRCAASRTSMGAEAQYKKATRGRSQARRRPTTTSRSSTRSSGRARRTSSRPTRRPRSTSSSS